MEKMEGISQKIISTFIIFFIFILCFQFNIINALELQDFTDMYYINPNDDIQQIIDQAKENATIIFNEGLYNQSFRINKPLKLSGISTEHTILSMKTKANNAAISISSPYVIFNNFTIENSASGLYTTGIRIDSSYVTISRCIFKNTPIGVAVWSDNVRIVDSMFTNCSDEGILLISTQISSSNDNEITNCVFNNNCDGIELQYSSGNIITDSIFSNNTHAGIDAICKDNNQNVISNCSFINNNVFDIYFASSKENLIDNCNIKNIQKKVCFNPSLESNIVTINFSSMNQPKMMQSSVGSTDQTNRIEQLLHSFLTKSFQFIQNFISQLQSIIF